MITGATKNKVDDIWQRMWEGGVTNPIEVIMQLTYLMFMKSLDDKELEAENMEMLGMTAKHVFPQTEEGQAIRWSRFKDLPAEQMFDVVSQKAFPFIKTMHSDNAFAESMEDAAFGFNKPKTLEKAVSGIDELLSNYVQDADDLGDLYEYMLSKLNTAGTNGQFRTPQHIRNMMVALAGPKPGQLICDPACGTAGFLISAAESIRKNHGQEMTEEQWKTFSGEQFTGFDTDQTMVRISAMNLLLHSIDHPDIRNQDSLSRLNAIRDKFDLILANPPFTGSVDVEDIDDSLKAVVETKQTELLFVALFLRMLKLGGRCVCIVPNGVLFRSNSKAYRQLRAELVDNQRLEAIIYMPSGVFKPYSGVSTAILVFTRRTQAARTRFGSTTWRATDTRSTTSAIRTRSTTTFPTFSSDGETSTRKNSAPVLIRAFWCRRAKLWKTITISASTSTRKQSTNVLNIHRLRKSSPILMI